MGLVMMTGQGLEVRYAILQDHPSMVEICREAFGNQARTPDDLRAMLLPQNTFALVAEETRYRRLIGYLVYTHCDKHYRLDELLVAPAYRWQRVATTLVDYLAGRLKVGGPLSILAEVPEHNLPMQCFLRRRGFKWRSTLAKGSEDESYLMILKLQRPECAGR